MSRLAAKSSASFVLAKASVDSLVKRLMAADHAYYNVGEPLISDAQYDEAFERLQKLEPEHPYLAKVGCKPHGEKVKLPVRLLSMTKVRPSDLQNWTPKFTAKSPKAWWMLPKLDGLTGLLHYYDGRLKAMYRRGDSEVGTDVSIHAPYIKGVPLRLKGKGWQGKHIFVPGEVCQTWSDFNSLSEGDRMAHPRNQCVGLLNRKDPDPKQLGKIQFVAFGLRGEDGMAPTSLRKAFGWMESWGLFTVIMFGDEKAKGFFREMCYSPIGVLPLDSESWMERIRRRCPVPTDGVVMVPDRYDLIKIPNTAGNAPKYAVAIKPDRDKQESQIGDVKNIEWEVSGRGLLKPTLVLEKELNFVGVKVSRATAFNAASVKKLRLGTGAKVEIIRSGDVIPHIHSVVEPGKVKLPKKCPACGAPTEWNATEVDLLCSNENCSGRHGRIMDQFFRRLGAEFLAGGTLAKLRAGGFTTVLSILRGKAADFAKLDGIGKVMAQRIEEAAQGALKEKSMAEVQYASGFFHSDTSSLDVTSLEKIHDTLEGKWGVTKGRLGKSVAENIYRENLRAFKEFYTTVHEWHTLPKKLGNDLKGRVICFSEFRDDNWKNNIKLRGGTYVEGLRSDVTDLITANDGSTKTVKAKERGGIKIWTVEQARKKWFSKP